GESAHFAVLGGDIAMANVHYARVGVSGAAAFGCFYRESGPLVHHARAPIVLNFSTNALLGRGQNKCRVAWCSDDCFDGVTRNSTRRGVSSRKALKQPK